MNFDWSEFAALVRTAHMAQGDETLDDNQRAHAATFAALGLAILELKHDERNNPKIITPYSGHADGFGA